MSKPCNLVHKQNFDKCRQAETLISQRLQASGWTIIARNQRSVGAEIDIIALKAQTLCFVEVKRRQSWPKLDELLPPKKQRAILKGVQWFLNHRPDVHYQSVRIDLAVVCDNRQSQNKIFYFKDVLAFTL